MKSEKYCNLNKFLITVGIVFIFLAILCTAIYASSIDSIDVSFDKSYYSVVEDSSVRIGFILTNASSDSRNLLIYSVCDEDELECNYENIFNLSGNSSTTSAFYVTSKDEGDSELKLYVKDIASGEEDYFSIDITSESDTDEGEFSVDLSENTFCIGRSTESYFTIDNSYQSGLYNLSLQSSTLGVQLSGNSQVYINTDEKDVDFVVEVPQNMTSGGAQDITLTISNDEVYVIKHFNVYLSECLEEDVDFSVSGQPLSNYVLQKGSSFSVSYTLTNDSKVVKTFFASDEQNGSQPLGIVISSRQFELAPGKSKVITATAYAGDDLPSGTYDLNLYFFNESYSITRKVAFQLQPKQNLDARLLQNAITLNIGQPFELDVVIENKGDFQNKVKLSYSSSNGLQMTAKETSATVNPHTEKIIPIIISAGNNTLEDTSQIKVTIAGENNDFYKQFTINVTAIKPTTPISIDYLSFPQEISVDRNSIKDFSFELFNSSNKDLMLSKIEVKGLPQGITYSLPINIAISSKISKQIDGRFTVGDLAPQEITVQLVFTASTGASVQRSLKIKVLGDDNTTPVGVSQATGFFTFGNSVFAGIIVLCLITILLFVFGIFKSHRVYSTIPSRVKARDF